MIYSKFTATLCSGWEVTLNRMEVQEINLDTYWEGRCNRKEEMRINEVQCLPGFLTHTRPVD